MPLQNEHFSPPRQLGALGDSSTDATMAHGMPAMDGNLGSMLWTMDLDIMGLEDLNVAQFFNLQS